MDNIEIFLTSLQLQNYNINEGQPFKVIDIIFLHKIILLQLQSIVLALYALVAEYISWGGKIYFR